MSLPFPPLQIARIIATSLLTDWSCLSFPYHLDCHLHSLFAFTRKFVSKHFALHRRSCDTHMEISCFLPALRTRIDSSSFTLELFLLSGGKQGPRYGIDDSNSCMHARNFQRLVHGDVHGLIHDGIVFARAGRRMISRIDSRFRAIAHAGYPLWRASYSQEGFLPFGATSWHTWTFQRDFRGILRPSSVRASYHLEQRRGILGPSLFPQEG